MRSLYGTNMGACVQVNRVNVHLNLSRDVTLIQTTTYGTFWFRVLSPFHFTVLSEICVAVSKLLHCTEICFSIVLITQSRTNVFILIKFQNLCNVAEKLISKLVFLIKFK